MIIFLMCLQKAKQGLRVSKDVLSIPIIVTLDNILFSYWNLYTKMMGSENKLVSDQATLFISFLFILVSPVPIFIYLIVCL